jgi:hypothetical protein
LLFRSEPWYRQTMSPASMGRCPHRVIFAPGAPLLSVASFNVHKFVFKPRHASAVPRTISMEAGYYRVEIKRERDNAVSEYDDANCGSEPADPVSTHARNKTKSTQVFVGAAATIGVIAAGAALFEPALIPGIAIGAAAAAGAKAASSSAVAVKLNGTRADRTRARPTRSTGRQGTARRPYRHCDKTGVGQDRHVSGHRHHRGLHRSLCCGRQPRDSGRFVSLPIC